MAYDRLREVLAGTDAEVARLGRYELERELGRGGMAVVYETWDPELDRRVALKVLHPGVPDRLRQEAAAAARLRHPNIVGVHEVGPGYIAMDLVDGRPLDEAARTMALADRVRAVEVVARAVAHAHGSGVIHRDIKPRNILVEGDGRIVLTDFGLAKVVGTNELTQTGASLGTPHYMAPEQILGRAVGPAADVWALGVLLHEMVTGRRPFEGEALGEVYDRILHRDPPAAPGALGAIVARALQRRPERRHPSAAAFADDLAGWLAGRSLASVRLRALLGKRRWAAGALLAVAIAGAVALRWSGRADPDEAELYLARSRVRMDAAVRLRGRDALPEFAFAEQDVRRALSLAPRSPEILEALSRLRWYRAAYLIDRNRDPAADCAPGEEDAQAPRRPRRSGRNGAGGCSCAAGGRAGGAATPTRCWRRRRW